MMRLIQKRCEMLLVALILACVPVLAQNASSQMVDKNVASGEHGSTPDGKTITVNGHVQDVAGLALPGATIVQVGTVSNATVANEMGDFKITLPSDSSIEVMFFGMKTEIVPVAGRTKLNVTLKEEAISIDEVIVTGYGSITKEA